MQELSQNYFELFGMQPSFQLDLDALAQNQMRLQANFHPDRYVNASERERRLSVQMMALIPTKFMGPARWQIQTPSSAHHKMASRAGLLNL